MSEELQPDIVLQDRFDQGKQVGELATKRFPDGVQIEVDRNAIDQAVADTKAALDAQAPFIFEASFFADNTFVAVDVLERLDDGFRLIEVKSSSSQKDEHIPDAAVQAHVLRESGVKVRATQIMHLNKEFRHPDQGDLFVSTDVTTPVDQMLARVPAEIQAQLEVLPGPLPDVEIGSHCFEPRDCPRSRRRTLEACHARSRRAT